MFIDHDLHVHTYLSSCCGDKVNQVPRSILALAVEMGISTIGFADHVWSNPLVPPSNWYRPQDETQIDRLRKDLSEISTPVRVLVGCEADMVAPGRFGITEEFAMKLDFVLLSCSHFHMKDFVEQPASNEPRDVACHLLSFFRSGVKSGLATSIAHPFVPCGHREYDKIIAAISDHEFEDALGLAAENKVGLEITTGFIPSGEGCSFSLETPLRILSLARKAGCKFTFGSDAHEPAAQRKLPQLSCLVGALKLNTEDLIPLVRNKRNPPEA